VATPTYEIYALKYAERTGTRGTIFMGGDPHDAPLDMDYFLWVLRSAAKTIVVDVGFGRAEGERRGRTFLRDPAEALGLIGVEADEVDDIVLTHMHYDHAGNLERFPRARFHIQDIEARYVTGRSMTHAALRHSFRLDDVLELVRLVHDNRVVFHAGAAEPWPGVELHRIGGHTPGQMSLRVNTARGPVVVASDAAHYYESFESARVFQTHESITEMLEGYRTLRTLAASDDHIIPGHDPLVLLRYPAPPHLDGIVALLHESPTNQSSAGMRVS
jgi:glyoxylase-like metal-dependent hydrolase (beta-lactamase superfamily II)